MNTIRFQVVPPIDHSREPIFLTGNLPALGDWEPSQALRLEWHAPWHTGSLEAEPGTHIEYKITRGSWEAEAVDAYGDVPGNLQHDVWLDATLHHTVADWKDCYSGRLTRETIHTRVLAGSRELLIWLPPGYGDRTRKRYPLLILHDGANIFDPATSPLSGVDWAADEWARRLAREGVLSESIVVGICHPEGFSEENETLRDNDLSPQLGGAAYAEFVTHDLLRHMDQHYRTLAEPSARVLGGSSLGALITCYIAIHHPGVFGNFACLSTHFGDLTNDMPQTCQLLDAVAVVPALAADTRMYFDYGTHGLDANYGPYHRRLGTLLEEKGWREGDQYRIQNVPGGGHDELSWRQRFGEALRFLAR